MLGNLPVVEAKQTAQPLSALDKSSEAAGCRTRLNQLVSKALVVTLQVVVGAVLTDRRSQRLLAKEDHSIEALP